MRYAQEYSGQRLHLVQEVDTIEHGLCLSATALCGRHCGKRGNWRMNINVPLGNACRNCQRVYAARLATRGG